MIFNYTRRGKFYHVKVYMHDHLCGVLMFTEAEFREAKLELRGEWNEEEKEAA